MIVTFTLKMAQLFDVNEFISDEGPCEFCGQPFPLQLLIEHQSGCRPDLLHYSSDEIAAAFGEDFLHYEAIRDEFPVIHNDKLSDDVPQSEEANILVNVSDLPKSHADVKKQLTTGNQLAKGNGLKPMDEEQCRQKSEMKNPYVSKQVEDSKLSDDLLVQEKGAKLMAYGATKLNDDEGEGIEKESFRIPCTSVLNNAQQKQQEPCCLSDDDESTESLEDFWRRASAALKQRQIKMTR